MQRPSRDVVAETILEAGSVRAAERILRERGYEISCRTISRWLAGAVPEDQPFSVELPGGHAGGTPDVNKLIHRRIEQFREKVSTNDREKIIPIRVNVDGPIGIGFVGDPHIDDDGTNIEKVLQHAELFDGRNIGLFAGNIGDITNNWTGRLAHLWSQQSTSAVEARTLATHYLRLVNWLFFIKGNHDCWANGSDILSFILQNNAPAQRDSRMRLALRLPSGRNVKIFAAHHFPGKSMWSEVYGAAKRAQLDAANHIYVSGHIHTSGYTHGWNDAHSMMWHAIQVASYKELDRYAEELNLERKDIYCCPVALIDPYAKSELNFIRFEFDPFEAVERLKWMRGRWEMGKNAS